MTQPFVWARHPQRHLSERKGQLLLGLLVSEVGPCGFDEHDGDIGRDEKSALCHVLPYPNPTPTLNLTLTRTWKPEARACSCPSLLCRTFS